MADHETATKAELVQLLHELATLTELDERDRQSFRARAYHNAVRALESDSRDVTALSAAELTGIKGIGRSMAAKVLEYVETGRIAKLDELRRRYPPGYVELVRVPGIGPKTVALLAEHLDVRSIDDLQAAVAAGALRDLPGLGEKTEQNIARAIERLGLHGKERRTPIADALPAAERMLERLRALPGVERAAYAGSLRRFREDVADLDILVASRPELAAGVADAFEKLPSVREVVARGDKKTTVLTAQSLQVDLRVVAPDEWGAALVYFTGSKAHNIRIRERAVRRGWTLNEYGLFEAERTTDEDGDEVVTTGDRLAAAAERDIYAALGLAWIPPGMREDVGEVDAAENDALPHPPEVADVRGDLHVHTDLSGDGRQSLEEVVTVATERGLAYLAITDHAENLSVNGVSRGDMLAQREQIAAWNARLGDLLLLHGAELNIGRDGTLDYDADFLLGFDWTVASVHSHFRLDAVAQTRRIVTAMEHPAVSAIGHLQGRRVGKRPPIDVDVGAVLDAAARTGTAIEINSNLDRLDASAEVLRAARDREGVRFVINTDAHHPCEFDFVRHGVRQAERGWVDRDRVVNCWPLNRFLDFVRAKRARA